jgi:hypothetical protein
MANQHTGYSQFPPHQMEGNFMLNPRYRPTITTENNMRVLKLDISTPEARANLILWYKVIFEVKVV